MIISRAPLRVSFLGGITDYPEYFMLDNKTGYVLGASINKWVNVMVLPQPDFENVKFRFTYRITESVNSFEEIMHPVVRNVLRSKNWKMPINIATMAQLPGRSGLGSSSAFTVAFLAALDTIQNGKNITEEKRFELAREAVYVERILLNEAGGIQDQHQASFGGFRLYEFKGNEHSNHVIGNSEFFDYLSNALVLIATGGGRDSNKFAIQTKERLKEIKKIKILDELSLLTFEVAEKLKNILDMRSGLIILGESINEAWKMKVELSGHESTQVDELLEFGIKYGAFGAKLCGAGGSGFAAFLVEPEKKPEFLSYFDDSDVIDVSLTNNGVQAGDYFDDKN